MKSKGFTLVELLVTMSILGIVSAVAFPNVSRMIEDYRVRTDCRRMMTDMQCARMRSVSDKIRSRINFDTDNNRYWIERQNEAGWVRTSGIRNLAQGVLMSFPNEANPAADQTLAFTALGEAPGGITARLTSANFIREVRVAFTGRVQIVQVGP
jgi:type II secretion system protein H